MQATGSVNCAKIDGWDRQLPRSSTASARVAPIPDFLSVAGLAAVSTRVDTRAPTGDPCRDGASDQAGGNAPLAGDRL